MTNTLAGSRFAGNGDPSFHLPMTGLQAGFQQLQPPLKNSGVVALIVRRCPNGMREMPASAEFSPEHGLAGDEWGRRLPLNPESQLAVMRRDVAELIANGQPLWLFGDNLFVDLDIEAGNLPSGSRLRIADTLVEVTPMAHNGCRKFNRRFGPDAMKFVNAPGTRHQNFRGVYWKVVEGGTIQVGSSIEVISRP